MAKIITTHVFPPIPIRHFDWHAYLDGQEEEGPNGWGTTEQEALDDLKDEMASEKAFDEASIEPPDTLPS